MRVVGSSFHGGHVLCPRCGHCAVEHRVEFGVSEFCDLSLVEVYVAAVRCGVFEPCDVWVDVMLNRRPLGRLWHGVLDDSLGR
jgi:hypothetical protein